jgi:cytoskeletal protein RodZ
VAAAAGAGAAAGAPVSAKGDARAMQSISHRPRRLGAPLAAIGAVAILVVILIVTGLHSNTPSHHGKTSATVSTTTVPHPPRAHHPTTTTTAAPLVSAPTAATSQSATYQVADANYSLALAATNGECWVQATNNSGAVLFSGVLYAGQSHTVPATGAVTVIAGAPNAFSATVNGAHVSLPLGFEAPFTLKFVSPGTAGAGL